MLSVSQSPTRRLTTARALAVIALCMVPVSTALTNIFCALFAIVLLSAPEFWRRLPTLIRHPASLAALLILAALALSAAWSVAPQHHAWEWIAKYDKLLLLPLAVVAFEDSEWSGVVCWSWFVTLCAILLLSTTNYLGLTAIGPAHAFDLPLSRAWVFKNHIAAGMFDALLFYQAADFALRTHSRKARYLFAAIGALTLVNVFVMMQGRTGQGVAMLLVLVVAVRFVMLWGQHSRLRVTLLVGLLIAGTAALVALTCTMHNSRLLGVASEIQQYRQSDAATSTGLRLAWYQRGLELYEQRPLAGYGAGGLEFEFARLSAGKSGAEGELTANPHNEYLLMAVQLGTLGLVLLLNLIVQIARTSRSLDGRSRHLLLAWLAIFVIGSLANSLLLDFAEGHLTMLLSGILLGCGYRRAVSSRADAGSRAA